MQLAYTDSESDSGSDDKVELSSKDLAVMHYFAASSYCYFIGVISS